ncbi:BppU family phage baseplate upper protein [Bacillus sp. A015]
MTNQLFKTGVLPFVVDAYDQSVYDSKIVFSTQDIGTAKLVFQMCKDGVPLPLSAVDGKLVLKFANGSKNIRNITLIDKIEGIAEYVLDNDEIKLYGKVQASLNLYYRNGQALSIHEFTFDIQRNLIDQDIAPAAEFYIDDFQSLKKQIERMAAELEADINKRTDDMQGKIDKITKELQEQLDHLKEKLGDLEVLETKEGAQAKVDEHAKNTKLHVTEEKQKSWDAKETTTGSQAKADAALLAAKKYTDEHANNKEIHVIQSDKDKWNNGQLYKMTQDSGTRKLIPDGSDLLTLPPGFYFGINNRLLNNPDPSDTGWFNYDVSESGSGRKMIIAVASYKNTMWYGTVHTNGDFKGWKRVVTDADLTSSWNQVTLVTGVTKHFAGNPLLFSIRQNTLHLRGSFEGIPANDAVIARFAQKPSTKAVFVGATVGSYGAARFTLEKDGSLRFDGMSANDNSFVSRFEINESIPLW